MALGLKTKRATTRGHRRRPLIKTAASIAAGIATVLIVVSLGWTLSTSYKLTRDIFVSIQDAEIASSMPPVSLNHHHHHQRRQQQQQQQQQREQEQEEQRPKTTCIMIRTVFPFPSYALDMIDHFAYEIQLYNDNNNNNNDDEYELVVRVDETNNNEGSSAQEFLDQYFEEAATTTKRKQHSNMTKHRRLPKQQQRVKVSSITLDTILDYFDPTLRQYLFNGTFANYYKEDGDCCKKPTMWQLGTPNDVHFVLTNKDKYKHVWTIEDDIFVVGTINIYDDSSDNNSNSSKSFSTSKSSALSSSSSSSSSLMELLISKDQVLNKAQQRNNTNDVPPSFVALEPWNQLGWWMQRRYTVEFRRLLDYMNTNRVKQMAVSDAIRRISYPAAQILYTAIVEKHQFAHIEGFIHPALHDGGHDIHWWNVPTAGYLITKIDEQEATAFLLRHDMPGAIYQKRRTPIQHFVITFSSFEKEEQTLLFLKSFQLWKAEMNAQLVIFTDLMADDAKLLRWTKTGLWAQTNATIVHAGHWFDRYKPLVPPGTFNPLKIFVLNEWLQMKGNQLYDHNAIYLVADEDVVFTNGKIFSMFGAYDGYSLLVFGEQKGVQANFNKWSQNCWDHTTNNKTIHRLAKEDPAWQMYNSGVLLIKGRKLPLLYKQWSDTMLQFDGSPKCDQTYLNYLIHTKQLMVQTSLVEDGNHYVIHLTTQRNRYHAFRRSQDDSVSLVHQWRWCNECKEDMKREMGLEGMILPSSQEEEEERAAVVPNNTADYVIPAIEIPQSKVDRLDQTFTTTRMTNELAVVLIALGPKIPNNTLVERCIHSMRRRGMHNGRVIVITDAPEDRFVDLTSRDSMVSIVSVTFNKVGLGNVRYEAWRYKSLIIDLLDNDQTINMDQNYEYILYMDVDVVVGRPMQPFIDYIDETMRHHIAKQSSPIRTSAVLMFEDQGKGKETLQKWQQEDTNKKTTSVADSGSGEVTFFHAGVIVMSRHHSRQCLDIWQNLITSKKFKDDQHALVHMQQNVDIQAQCEIKEMDPQYLHFPTKETMQQGITSVLVHVTISRRAVLIPDDLQETYFRDVLELDENLSRALCGKWGTCS